MNVQQHERITRIKQFSRSIYVCLTWIRYFLWVTWPLMAAAIIFSFDSKANITLGNMRIDDVELTIVQRVLIVAFISALFFLALKLANHCRDLIRYFSEGDIFNKQAIDHARKALFSGLIMYGLYLCASLGGWIYTVMQSSPTSVSINGDFIFGMMFFGLMYVLLWALEIGCDLNEESELTI